MVMGRKSPAAVALRDLGMKTVRATFSSTGTEPKASQLVKRWASTAAGTFRISLRVRPSGPGAVVVSVAFSMTLMSSTEKGSTETSPRADTFDVMLSTWREGVDMSGSYTLWSSFRVVDGSAPCIRSSSTSTLGPSR